MVPFTSAASAGVVSGPRKTRALPFAPHDSATRRTGRTGASSAAPTATPMKSTSAVTAAAFISSGSLRASAPVAYCAICRPRPITLSTGSTGLFTFDFRLPTFDLLSGAFCRLGIPLPLAHARDGDAREHAVLGKRVAIGELLRFRAAPDVHDEQAADRLRALVVLRRAGEHEDLLLAAEVVAVRLQHLLADRGGVRLVYAGNGPKHSDLPGKS